MLNALKNTNTPNHNQDCTHTATLSNYHYSKDYVENNLIAYIGNKKRLLPLIVSAIKEVEQNDVHAESGVNTRGLFIDYFAGTGVVSRLAKSLGYSVIANDWEVYAQVINRAFIEMDATQVKQMFGGCEDESENISRFPSLDAFLEELNGLTREEEEKSLETEKYYISKFYCPKQDENVDVEKERMFYTHYNGVLIDNIRERIEAIYRQEVKNGISPLIASLKKNFLLALLLIEASKRSNTSGVFKGFHKGFGGKGSHALGRILKPITLTKPMLCSPPLCDEGIAPKRHKVFKADAQKLAEKLHRTLNITADIVYLDPPYNQHQYGSNYHLLNTIALDDKPKISTDFWINGKKRNKSGIRQDWTKTRSAYCYKSAATRSFKNLIDTIKANYILVSYSTEGIIDFNIMLDILCNKGKVGIITKSYVRYRGGRQANTTKNKNLEFVIMLNTRAVCTAADRSNVEGILLKSSIYALEGETFPLYHPDVEAQTTAATITIKLKVGKTGEPNPSWNFFINLNTKLQVEKSSLSTILSLPPAESRQVATHLKALYAYNNSDEIDTIACYLQSNSVLVTDSDSSYLMRHIKRLCKKINPHKDALAYNKALAILKTLERSFCSSLPKDKAKPRVRVANYENINENITEKLSA